MHGCTSFWPGLTLVWYRGATRGLVEAVLFAWAICVLLLATFFWTDWIVGWQLALLWLAAVIFWGVELVRSQLGMQRVIQTENPDTDEGFAQAQTEYLRGNWFEAEAILLDIVQAEPRDIASGLLLVGVLRHTRRWQPAMRRLEQMTLMDAAAGWQFEIQSEKRLIRRAQEESEENALAPQEPAQPTPTQPTPTQPTPTQPTPTQPTPTQPTPTQPT